MNYGFNILYNEEDDVLDIIKQQSNNAIDCTEGKYGILFYRDISDNIIRISIPEPEILFGVPISFIKSFVTYSSSF